EPRLVGTVVLGRVERLHDVLLASFPMLGCRRQVFHVDHEVLGPVLQILLRNKSFGVLSDPVWDVVWKLAVLLCMETLLERNLNYMRASVRGRDELAIRVQQALLLPTKKQAAH